MATLITITPDGETKYLPLGRGTKVLGRDESLPLQVLDDRASRRHAQVRLDDKTGHYFVLDMKSTNGTYVNGRRIYSELELKDGDEIEIGSARIHFTTADFADKESAMAHFKKAGERRRSTIVQE